MQNNLLPVLNKELKFKEEARQELIKGIEEMFNALKVTLGPRGRNVLLDKFYADPVITNDGVSISKEIRFKNRYKNAGALILSKVAEEISKIAGDGTTTGTILAALLMIEGFKMVLGGIDSLSIGKGMYKAKDLIIEKLSLIKKDVSTKEDLEHVATIATEDPEAGKLIADIMDKAKKDGVVTVEEGQSFGLSSEYTEGLKYDKGFKSQYMITNADRIEAEITKPLVLVTDIKMSSMQEIVPLLNKMDRAKIKDLLIIAESITGEALATINLNKIKGMFNLIATDAPGITARRKELLEDIATAVGATVISEDKGMKLENVTIEMCGKADRVVSSLTSTLIVGGQGDKASINDRIKQLEGSIARTDNELERNYLNERLAKLKGGVSIIKFGAASDLEFNYKKLKLVNGVNSTRAALEEGVLAGGGSAFIKALSMIGESTPVITDPEEKIGFDLVLKIIQLPLKQLAINAGIEDISLLKKFISDNKFSGWDFKKIDPYNIDKAKVEDMFKTGITDAFKVVRTGLEQAVSSASTFLTTDVVVAILEDEITRLEDKLA